MPTYQSSCADDYDATALSLHEAQKRINSMVRAVAESEVVDLWHATERIAAADVESPSMVPGGDNSAMDGYAVRQSDLMAATGETVWLKKVGTAFAGRPFAGTVQAGECVRIMTGGIIPRGCDTVVIQEHAREDGASVAVKTDYQLGQNIRRAGEDIKVKDKIIARGKKLSAADLGLLASVGIQHIKVWRKVRCAIFSSGDELRAVGSPLKSGQLYDSNRYTMHGMLASLPVDIINLGVVADQRQALQETFRQAQQADVIISSGGVSVGEADFIKEVMASLGTVNFWKVAIKPGRPLACGSIGDSLYFGLPGNPVSVMVTFIIFVQPALQMMGGQAIQTPLLLHAQCLDPLRKRPGRAEFQRGIMSMHQQADGTINYTVKKTGQQGSGVLQSMARANCLIMLPEANSGIKPGDTVRIMPLPWVPHHFMGGQRPEGEIHPPEFIIRSMRDSGYRDTAHALAGLIDNSVQAKAKDIEVICMEESQKTHIESICVIDNGEGMTPDTLRLALQFGKGTHLQDRRGIGRFGMGLPNASISQCRRVEVWTWQNGCTNSVYSYLDVDEIEDGRMTLVPEPIPKQLPQRFKQRSNILGKTGTLVLWTKLDDYRITWHTARSTLSHTESLIGRIYRKYINDDKLCIWLLSFVNGKEEDNRLVRVNDPLYLMKNSSTPAPFDQEPMFQKWGEQDQLFIFSVEGVDHEVIVRASWARPETVSEAADGDRGSQPYGKHAAKNLGVSILRHGRELKLDDSWAHKYDPIERWWGVEIDFPSALDEVFGVTNDKQEAVNFSQMSHYNWQDEAKFGETFSDFKQRMSGVPDAKIKLLEIAQYIKGQINLMKKKLKGQTKGRRRNI